MTGSKAKATPAKRRKNKSSGESSAEEESEAEEDEDEDEDMSGDSGGDESDEGDEENVALHPSLLAFPPLTAPPGFSIVDANEVAPNSPWQAPPGVKAKKKAKEMLPDTSIIMFKWDSDKASDPRGWFRGSVRKLRKHEEKKERKRGFTHNVVYSNKLTNDQIFGWVATKLDLDEYEDKWVLLKRDKVARK
jgi:hypothetical protein